MGGVEGGGGVGVMRCCTVLLRCWFKMLYFLKMLIYFLKMLYCFLRIFLRCLQDSNYCFNSLAIRLQSNDLKHLIPGNGVPKLQG